jgi:5-formyltetrahydrofolate cyclo-ligase
VPVSSKAAVRARLRATRRERVPTRDGAADAEQLALAGLHAAYAAGLASGDWVTAYESMPSEPPTQALVAALSARGIRVMVPVTLADWDLDWREVGTDALLGPDAIGAARLVFLPAHGVDTLGTRIGQGKGCYDRALPRTDAMLVAVVHPWEVLTEPLPREPHDQPVDAVITADGGFRSLVATQA